MKISDDGCINILKLILLNGMTTENVDNLRYLIKELTSEVKEEPVKIVEVKPLEPLDPEIISVAEVLLKSEQGMCKASLMRGMKANAKNSAECKNWVPIYKRVLFHFSGHVYSAGKGSSRVDRFMDMPDEK